MNKLESHIDDYFSLNSLMKRMITGFQVCMHKIGYYSESLGLIRV